MSCLIGKVIKNPVKQVKDRVTPWKVIPVLITGIDYDKLIRRFDSSKISPELIRRIESIIQKPVHHFIRRGIFFSHRDLELISTADAKENNECTTLSTDYSEQ